MSSPARTNSGSVSESQPREVLNVAVLTESELGSEAQRERRKRILDATLAIASKGGYEAVQMRAVAERAGVAVGTLYRYFPSKVHLLVSALGREFERIDAKTDRATLTGATAGSVSSNMLNEFLRGRKSPDAGPLSFREYSRIGIPVALCFLIISSVYITMVYSW